MRPAPRRSLVSCESGAWSTCPARGPLRNLIFMFDTFLGLPMAQPKYPKNCYGFSPNKWGRLRCVAFAARELRICERSPRRATSGSHRECPASPRRRRSLYRLGSAGYSMRFAHYEAPPRYGESGADEAGVTANRPKCPKAVSGFAAAKLEQNPSDRKFSGVISLYLHSCPSGFRIDNGTYRSTGVFHERKKSSGSCVPTKWRANARRLSTSCRCPLGRSWACFSTPAKNCSRLTTLVQSSITLESCSRLSLVDSATRRRSSSWRHRSCSSATVDDESLPAALPLLPFPPQLQQSS